MSSLDMGISPDDFFRDYFERNFYVRDKALDADLLTLTDIERLLYGADPCDAAVRLFMKGAVPLNEYAQLYNDVDGPKYRFIAESIQRLLAEGATMVMNRVDRKFSSVGTLCDQIAEFIGERTVANAYMCFSGAGTFGVHWDTHDVFAVQLQGRKRWRVYGSTHALPLTHQTSRDQKALCPTTPLFDKELDTGDLLYIPRGWWHEATPLQNQMSIHIAIGVHTIKYFDYLLWFCETVAPTLLEARTTIRSEENAALLTSALLPRFATALRNQEYVRQFLALQNTRSIPRYLLGRGE